MCRFENTWTAAQPTHGKLPVEFGRRVAEFVSERVGEMRVAGEAKVQRKHSEIRFAIREVFQCVA
jgi:hypothetical protein